MARSHAYSIYGPSLRRFSFFRRILMPFRFFPACSHAHSLSKYLLLFRPLGLCSFHPLLQSGNLMPMFVPASLSIVQRFILVSDILSITVHLLSFLQFKVAFDTLLARAPALEQFSRTHESQKASLMFEIRHMVTELVRLSTLDPSLSEERRFCSRP